MTTTIANAIPHLSAVRIGNGAAVHAGHRAAYADATAPPVYAASCGAGRGWRGDGGTWSVATGAPVPERVTCRNCVRTYAAAVETIHASQQPARRTALAT